MENIFDTMANANAIKVEPKPWMVEKTLALVTKTGRIQPPKNQKEGREDVEDKYDLPALGLDEGEGNGEGGGDDWKMLDEVIDACIESGLYALDLETTGLDNRVFPTQSGALQTKDHIVGICLSPDGERGYYIPVAHTESVRRNGVDEIHNSPHNVPVTKVREAMKRLTDSDSVAIFHNGKFDHEFLEFHGAEPWGTWDQQSKWEDTLILAYLRNSRARNKSLKALSEADPKAPEIERGLGMEMIKIHELWGHSHARKKFNYDFSTRDPSDEGVIWYAASDAICTYLLFKLLHPIVCPPGDPQSQNGIYSIEKAGVTATRWMERCRVHTDRDKVAELIGLGQREFLEALNEVYETASEKLGRDITPLHWYAVMEEIEKENPDLEISATDPHGNAVVSLMERIEQCKHRVSKGLTLQDSKLIHEKAQRREVIVQDAKGKDVERPPTYDVMSPQQLGAMLDELNVPGLVRTPKSGQIQTSADAIDNALTKGSAEFPWLGRISRFRNVHKALSTYLYPLWFDAHPDDHTIKVVFNGHRTDTGRYSVPKGKKKDGGTSFPMHGTPSTYDPNRPECLARLRECISARPGKVIVAIDYSGEELRIVTNLSREPKWLKEFFRCSSCGQTFDQGDGTSTPQPPPPFCPKCGSDKIGDVHTLTAISVYGEEAQKRDDWKQLRGNGKRTNFALCYGGGGRAVQRAISCDKNEGWRVKRQFDANYTALAGWWDLQHEYARKHKYVRTAFGRHYPLPDIDHEDGGFRSKAERNATNGPIQGTGADIIKLAKALVYKEVKKRDWFDKVFLIATMHDELVFEIDLDIIEEAVDLISHVMTRNKAILDKKWPVPLTVDVEAGWNWTVKWNVTEMRHGKVPWCEELHPYFKGTGEPPKDDDPTPPTGAEEKSEEPKVEDKDKPVHDLPELPTIEEGSPTEAPKPEPQQPLTTSKAGDTLTFMLFKLDINTMLHVAQVISEEAGLGTRLLKLVDKAGEEIRWSDEPVRVAEIDFVARCKRYGRPVGA